MGTADNSDCDLPIWVCLCGYPPIEGNGNCPSCGAEPPWGSPYDDDEPPEDYDPWTDYEWDQNDARDFRDLGKPAPDIDDIDAGRLKGNED